MTTSAKAQIQPSEAASRSWLAPVILALWTLFVWGGRLRNLALDDGGFATASRWSLTGSIIFVCLSAAVLLAIGLKRPPMLTAGAVTTLGLFTVAVWVVRGIGIARADHPAAFIAVHTALALISICLAMFALKTAGLQRRLGMSRAAG